MGTWTKEMKDLCMISGSGVGNSAPREIPPQEEPSSLEQCVPRAKNTRDGGGNSNSRPACTPKPYCDLREMADVVRLAEAVATYQQWKGKVPWLL